MNRATGFELFPAKIYGFSELPAMIVSRDIALICGSALVICLLAGVLPAWSAGRLKPVEALRQKRERELLKLRSSNGQRRSNPLSSEPAQVSSEKGTFLRRKGSARVTPLGSVSRVRKQFDRGL